MAIAALMAACSGGGGGGAGGGSGTAGGSGTGGGSATAGGSGNAGGSGGNAGGQSATLVSLAIAPGQVMLGVPETQALTATGTYSDNSMRDVTAQAAWSSSAMAVVSVSAAGVVTAAMNGSAVITATLDGKSAMVTVTVNGPALSSVAVTPATLDLGVGQAVQYVATGTFADGTTRNVAAEAVWSSNAAAVAAVSATGRVTAMSAGSATIEATLRGKKGMATATVGAKTVTALKVTPPNLVVAPTETRQLAVTATYSDGSTGDVTSAVRWSVEGMNPAVTVSATGLYTGVSSASFVRVTASLQGVDATIRTMVTNPGFALTGLMYMPQNIPRGLTFPDQWPDAIFTNVGSTNFTLVEWTSSNPAVLELLPGGGWKGVSVGTVTMTAKTYTASGMLTATGMVSVTEPVPDSIRVSSGASGTATLAQGATLQLSATGQSALFPALNADLTSQVMWSSSNMSAVTVDAAGLARGVGQGTATITARLGTAMGTTTITVPASVPPQMMTMVAAVEDNSVLISSVSPNAENTVYATNALLASPGVAVGCAWYWNPPIGPAPERFDALCSKGLIKFDLSPLAGKTVISAHLVLTTKVYGIGIVPRRWSIHALASPWSGSTVTWNTASGFQYYVYSETQHDPPTFSGQVFDLDQTNTVKNWVSGAYVNAGWELGTTNYLYPYVRTNSLDPFELYSREDPGGNGPKLVVQYR